MGEPQQTSIKRYIGLRNIVTSRSHWRYLLLYEIDSHDVTRVWSVMAIFNEAESSYICYKTKNGYHFVGLTPMDSQQWGYWFHRLQMTVPEYFSGQTLRMSRKEGELQELAYTNFNYPFLHRLARSYLRRFGVEEIREQINPPVYTCVFEKYWTGKI